MYLVWPQFQDPVKSRKQQNAIQISTILQAIGVKQEVKVNHRCSFACDSLVAANKYIFFQLFVFELAIYLVFTNVI